MKTKQTATADWIDRSPRRERGGEVSLDRSPTWGPETTHSDVDHATNGAVSAKASALGTSAEATSRAAREDTIGRERERGRKGKGGVERDADEGEPSSSLASRRHPLRPSLNIAIID